MNNIPIPDDPITVESLQHTLQIISTNIMKHEASIQSLRHQQNNTRLQIWDLCEHTWHRDVSAASDDIYKYYCKTCNLYKSRNLYQRRMRIHQ
jgi:hypothetical protein